MKVEIQTTLVLNAKESIMLKEILDSTTKNQLEKSGPDVDVKLAFVHELTRRLEFSRKEDR